VVILLERLWQAERERSRLIGRRHGQTV